MLKTPNSKRSTNETYCSEYCLFMLMGRVITSRIHFQHGLRRALGLKRSGYWDLHALRPPWTQPVHGPVNNNDHDFECCLLCIMEIERWPWSLRSWPLNGKASYVRASENLYSLRHTLTPCNDLLSFCLHLELLTYLWLGLYPVPTIVTSLEKNGSRGWKK